MNISWRHILILLLLTGLWHGVQSQSTGAKADMETDTVLIGDQQWLSLELTIPKGSKVTSWPIYQDTLIRYIEVLRTTSIDTISSDKESFTLKQQLLITAFDSGEYVIPPIPFRFLLFEDTTTYYTETVPLRLFVNSPEVDQAGDIKPIKSPLKAPVTFAEIATWLGIALVVILAVLSAIYLYRRKKAKKPVFQIRTKPKLPPHQMALNALENLRQKKLWQAGRVKDYYTELTDIIRIYVEGRYNIMAMEMTTEEIMASLRKTDSPQGVKDKLYGTLVSADMVKFAKARPLPDENETNFRHCVDFVRETRPVTDLRQSEEKNDVTVKVEEEEH